MGIENFNKTFQQFEGEVVPGSAVNAMLEAVVKNNTSYKADGNQSVDVYSTELETAPIIRGQGDIVKNTDRELTKQAQNNRNYKVKCLYDEKTGYITAISVTVVDI